MLKHTPILPGHQWVKRCFYKDYLNVVLIYAKQKIKFKRFLTNLTSLISATNI